MFFKLMGYNDPLSVMIIKSYSLILVSKGWAFENFPVDFNPYYTVYIIKRETLIHLAKKLWNETFKAY